MTPGGKPHSSIHWETFHDCVWSVFGSHREERVTHRQRGLLTAFQHNSDSCCCRRSNLFAEEDQWRVPRDDNSNDCKGLPQAQVQEPRCVQIGIALNIYCLAKVIAVDARIIGVEIAIEWTAHRYCVEGGQFILPGQNLLCHLPERLATFCMG